MEPGADHGHTSLLTYMAAAGVPYLPYANTCSHICDWYTLANFTHDNTFLLCMLTLTHTFMAIIPCSHIWQVFVPVA